MTAPSGVAAIRALPASARKTYKLEIYDELHELIQSLELPPGARLVEHELSERFGVSKTPVREALLLLERERLVTLVPHVGARVTWLSLDEYEQLLFISDALEQPALPLVSKNLDDTARAACVKALKEIEKAYRARDSRRFGELVKDFHIRLFSLAGYPLLTEMVENVQRLARRYSSAFVHQYPDNWAREVAVVRERFEQIAEGRIASARDAVHDGHAALLTFAAERVASGDPLVSRFITDGTS